MFNPSFWLARFATACLLATGSASAGPAWTLDLGAGVLAQPRYPGASGLTLAPRPLVDLWIADRLFISLPRGVGVKALNWTSRRCGTCTDASTSSTPSDETSRGRFSASVGMALVPLLVTRRDDAVRGLDGVPLGVEARGHIELGARPLWLHVDVGQALWSHHRGLSAKLESGVAAPVKPGWIVQVAVGASAMDARAMTAWYATATRSPIERVWASALVARQAGRFRVAVSGAPERLIGGAASSPFVSQRWAARITAFASVRFTSADKEDDGDGSAERELHRTP